MLPPQLVADSSLFTYIRTMNYPAEHYDLGGLGGQDGHISASLAAPSKLLNLHVSVPGDRRRTPINVRISIGALRDLVARAERAEEEAARAERSRNCAAVSSSGTEVVVMGTKLSIALPVYERLKSHVAAGENKALMLAIAQEFPSLNEKAISELAFTIYRQQRPRA